MTVGEYIKSEVEVVARTSAPGRVLGHAMGPDETASLVLDTEGEARAIAEALKKNPIVERVSLTFRTTRVSERTEQA